jgi:aryl-alcohol dehydrogenase-like predicted oxidoreductase
MPVNSWATLEGTARYRERMRERTDENHFRLEQDLWLSSIGTGTYLGDADEATDARYVEALVQAVSMGANLIDTAANYRFQRSERTIGVALERMKETGVAARDEVVICTKGGYLPFDGAPPRDVRRYVEEHFVRPGIAELSDFVGGSHCMTPRYLQSQIDQSLLNMRLDCIDVYYIHNPESQLAAVSREEFETRLRAAFELLEQNIKGRKIRRYGVATWNGFRASMDARGYHSLERMVALAREAGDRSHGFRFIQLPFNLAMHEALTSANQMLEGVRVSLLEAARALGVAVVASASILQGKVARGLSEEIREPLGSLATDAQTAIQFVRSTPGITTALVGMSRLEHVEENLQLARLAPTLTEDYQRLFAGPEE